MPPTKIFQLLTDAIQNPFLHKDVKIQTIEVMGRLTQLDLVARFGYSGPSKNPYYNEAVKYHSLYIEILKKGVKHHTEDKLTAPSGQVKDQIMSTGDDEKDFIKS